MFIACLKQQSVFVSFYLFNLHRNGGCVTENQSSSHPQPVFQIPTTWRIHLPFIALSSQSTWISRQHWSHGTLEMRSAMLVAATDLHFVPIPRHAVIAVFVGNTQWPAIADSNSLNGTKYFLSWWELLMIRCDHEESYDCIRCLLRSALRQSAVVSQTCTMEIAEDNAQTVTHTRAMRDNIWFCPCASLPWHWFASKPSNGDSWKLELVCSCRCITRCLGHLSSVTILSLKLSHGRKQNL